MKSRFSIPLNIAKNLTFKGRGLRSLTGYELTEVHERIRTMRRRTGARICVAIPAFNEETNLYATIRSISLQTTNRPVDICVIDNNSTDRTAELAKKLGVSVIHESEQGVAHARQKALRLTKADFYICADADTIYPPMWIELLVSPLANETECAVSYSLHGLYDEDNQYSTSFFLYQYAKLAFVLVRNMKRPQLNCGGASMAFRTIQALHVGGFNTNLQRGEDGMLALKLSALGKIKLVSSKHAQIFTSNRRIQQDENLSQAFIKRALRGVRNSLSFLTTQNIPS